MSARGSTRSVCKDADDAVKRYAETDQVPCLALALLHLTESVDGHLN